MATSHHILLLGGHGKIAQLLTPLLLRRSWTVTSVIRTPEQVPEIAALGANEKGTLHVLVRSLEEMRSDADAKAVLDEVQPDMVVWSAGAGGKGNPERVSGFLLPPYYTSLLTLDPSKALEDTRANPFFF